MSGGLLNLGARALMSNQVALQVTGNNISNVNTAGYSRQTAVMSAVQGDFTGSGSIGKGVEVSTVQRVYDEFLTKHEVTFDQCMSLSQQLAIAARIMAHGIENPRSEEGIAMLMTMARM